MGSLLCVSVDVLWLFLNGEQAGLSFLSHCSKTGVGIILQRMDTELEM